MLTVMSGMDPHMISGTWDGSSLVGFVEVGLFRLWVSHGETPWFYRDRYFEVLRLLFVY
jgi:hypothetical protein